MYMPAPFSFASVNPYMADTGILWFVKLTSVPSMSKNRNLFILYAFH